MNRFKLYQVGVLRQIFFAINILFFMSVARYGQVKSGDESIGGTFLSDFYSAVNVGINAAERPLQFSQSDWLKVGAFALGTTTLFLTDKSVRSFALSNQSDLNDVLFGIDGFYGSKYTSLLSAGIYGLGLFSGNDEIRKLGLLSSEAFIISGLGITILKVIIGRRRPYKGESNLFFKPFTLSDNDFFSLPSGHTTIAVAVSTVMAQGFDNIYWKTFWYGAAGLTAVSRIYHNQHWVSDVFLGAVIGYYVGRFVIDDNINGQIENSSVYIFPTVSFNRVGISLFF